MFFWSVVNCYPGSYSESKTQTCVPCKPGFYQDEEGKEECQPCPKNTSSVITGSKSAADCKRKMTSLCGVNGPKTLMPPMTEFE